MSRNHTEFDQFLRKQKEGITPNLYTLISISKAVGKLGDLDKSKIVHSYASELGMESSVLVGTALIDMYAKCKSLSDARSVFDLNFTSCKTNPPWNAMISGYSQCGHNQEALELFVRMCANNIKPDKYTYCSVFNAIAALKCLHLGKEIHWMVLKSGIEMKVTSVSNAYAKCELLEDVQKREKGFTLNEFTISSVLVACASFCFLEYGQQVHGLLCKVGLDTEKCIESALVDMYAKCGNIAEAQEVYERISEPDTVSWTAIISGHAQHGLVEDALELLKRMVQMGVKANDVTLLCVLFACSHRGMVKEGLNHFHQMEKSYGVVSKMEHYACIVDLLGRAGRLNDAMEFIERMPIEPNEMILSVTPESSDTYLLLSNTYIRTGSYEDGLSLSDVMSDRGVKNEPGCSWISVKGRIHKFYAGDQQHPEKHDIYAKVEVLRVKLKSMGYIPDLCYVLQDVNLVDKGGCLDELAE
ncbi:hypothetical protein PS2_001532 [Malus domestica]